MWRKCIYRYCSYKYTDMQALKYKRIFCTYMYMRNVKYEISVIKNVTVISIFDTDVLTIVTDTARCNASVI